MCVLLRVLQRVHGPLTDVRVRLPGEPSGRVGVVQHDDAGDDAIAVRAADVVRRACQAKEALWWANQKGPQPDALRRLVQRQLNCHWR